MLGQDTEVGVVPDHDREGERLHQEVDELHVRPTQVGCEVHQPVGGADQPRDGDTDSSTAMFGTALRTSRHICAAESTTGPTSWVPG